MLTDRERIERLEEDLAKLRRDAEVGAGLVATTLVIALDELVDRRVLAAEVRTEIIGRVRKDIAVFRGPHDSIYYAVTRSLPRYQTEEERRRLAGEQKEFRRQGERLRRERLSLRQAEAEGDQSEPSTPTEPEPS